MTRRHLLAALSVVAPLLVWTSCAFGPRAEPGGGPAPARPRRALDAAFDWQAQVLCDTLPLPPFEVGGTKVPQEGAGCFVLVPKAGEDPAPALREAASAAAGEKDFRAWWAAPDAATDAAARAAAVPGIDGAVAPQVGDAIPVDLRPALLVVGPDGRIQFAHLPGSAWDPELFAYEAREIAVRIAREKAKRDGSLRIGIRRITPPPQQGFKGALWCGACHRGFFRDWLLTPHSVALADLEHLERDGDPECIKCHVIGWEKGGYSDRDRHRAFADVQCEACHLPERTHSPDRPMSAARGDYEDTCGQCHTQNFSFFSDPALAMKYVSHPQREAAEFDPKVSWAIRDKAIGALKDQMYAEVCGKTDFVGSSKCLECHKEVHASWSGTPHAMAFAALEKEGKAEDPKCLPCHTTGFGQKKGFQSLAATPDFAGVGCESCHGPGLKHVEAKTDEERRTTIFAFDEKCPTCVITRICQSCHDEHKRPCFVKNERPFEIIESLQKVRHRKPR